MSSEKSYLEKLKFDPELKKGPVSSYLSNFRLTFLLIIGILIAGMFSYFNLPQRLNPQINIPIVIVTTILPGASPQDVESLVTVPIEDQLAGVTGIDSITSSTRENVSVIQAQFVSGTNPKSAEQDVQTEVNKITSLPTDAKTPTVKALDFEDQPIWTFALSSKEELPSLMRFADTLKKAIDKSDKVDRIELSGYEEREIQVALSPEKLRELNINPLLLSQSIQRATKAFPAGALDTGKYTVSLTINPEITTVEDIRALLLVIQGKSVRLGDIAVVSEQPKDNQLKAFYASTETESTRVVLVNVYKTRTADINMTSDEVKKIVSNTLKPTDGRFTITTIVNTSDEIRKQFTDLLGEFKTTILLVFICLLLFVGLRQAIISAFTVPLTFLMAFIFMPMFGISINFLTLFAFLLALGLLIDDTIVIVSSMTTYYRTKKFNTHETGLLVWKDFIIPIWSTTITTIWSFVPLLLATGIIGEFIKPIPLVIAITMISSTAIAVLITLPLMMIILEPRVPRRVTFFLQLLAVISIGAIILALAPKSILLPLLVVAAYALLFVIIRNRAVYSKKLSSIGFISWLTPYFDKPVLHLEPVANGYKNVIKNVLSSRKSRIQVLVSIILFAVVSYALVPFGFVKNEFFPKTNEDLFYVNVEYPAGSNADLMTTNAQPIMDILRKLPGANFVTASIGSAVGGQMSGGGGQNEVGFTVHLEPAEERAENSIEIANQARQSLQGYTAGKVSVVETSAGPPAGSDVQIELSGDDLSVVDEYATKIISYLQGRPGLTNIEKSLKPGTSQIVFTPNETELNKNGITTDTIGFWLRTFTSGLELDSIRFKGNGSDEETIRLKLGAGTQSPQELGNIVIPSNTASIPLLSLGSLSTEESPTQITRQDRKRTITVSASIKAGEANGTEEGKALEKFADSLNLPQGYAWKTGGVNEENAKSVQSIIQSMGLAFILILVTMVVQFKSFRQAFIALIVIPLAVSSVFFVFALTGTPLSFPALIGILALFGIIVTNSMFIIDKINLNRKQNMPFIEAIADAGSSRLEPIVLTKLCTVLGLLPISISQPLWRGLGGAIISGVLLASTFMLLFIPVVYYALFAKEEEAKDLKTRTPISQ